MRIYKLSINKIGLVLLLVMLAQQTASFDPTVDAWDTVADWELEVCSKWGGTSEVPSPASESSPVYLSQTTISLQAKEEIYHLPDYDKKLYKASWYLEPLDAMEYRVVLISPSGEFKLGEGDASYDKPGAGYFAQYSNENYTYIKMEYGTEWVMLPVVQSGQLPTTLSVIQ